MLNPNRPEYVASPNTFDFLLPVFSRFLGVFCLQARNKKDSVVRTSPNALSPKALLETFRARYPKVPKGDSLIGGVKFVQLHSVALLIFSASLSRWLNRISVSISFQLFTYFSHLLFCTKLYRYH